MFRHICSRISTILNNSGNFELNFMRSFCNSIELQDERKFPLIERLKATIYGKITKIHVDQNTDKLNAIVKTVDRNRDEFSTLHHVVCPGHVVKRLNRNILQVGERVYVDGFIQYFPFTTVDNKPRAAYAINARKFDISCPSVYEQKDINEVSFFGHVPEAAVRKEKCTYMRVATRYFDLHKSQGSLLRYHSLEIHDEELQNLANALEAGALVYVNGSLRSYHLESNDGFRKLVTLCVPHNLVPTRRN